MAVTQQPKLFWAGAFLYAGSFFLSGVAFTSHGFNSAPGYSCAYISLAMACSQAVSWSKGEPTDIGRTEIVSLFASGMTNVFFVIAVWAVLFKRSQSSADFVYMLRFLVLSMFPFCWVVFHYEKLLPLWGYYVWVIGMVLVLYASKPFVARAEEGTPSQT